MREFGFEIIIFFVEDEVLLLYIICVLFVSCLYLAKDRRKKKNRNEMEK